MASSKSVVIVSDMHDGGATLVCTPEPTIADLGTTYKPNKLQKALYRVWNDCIDELIQKPNLLVVNGEPHQSGSFSHVYGVHLESSQLFFYMSLCFFLSPSLYQVRSSCGDG